MIGKDGSDARGDAPDEALVLYDAREGVATLTLNRPAKRNALSADLVDRITAEIGRAGEDDSVRVVVIRGAGKDFCAGADIAEMEASLASDPMASLDDAGRLGGLYARMRRHPNPIVSVVHGRALGGGCGLATASDMVLAREDAEFGYPEVRLGFVPAIVMAILGRKILEGAAFELVTTGGRISAAEAHRIGLVNRVFDSSRFSSGVEEFVEELAARPPSAVALTKRLLYGVRGASFEEDVARGAEMNALARQTDAFRAGVRAFLDRSPGKASSSPRKEPPDASR